jgi:plasmid segregation protein ParM
MFIEPAFLPKEPVVLGIDVGYSATKMAYTNDGTIVTATFASVATRTPRNAFMSGMEGLGAREADVKVSVNGVSFAVDTSNVDVVESSVTRTENDDFATTDEHYALVCAALVRAGFRQVDQLVLGLPLTTFDTYAPELRRKFRGVHDFGHGRIAINDALVLPQPFGGYTSLLASNPGALSNGTSVGIIDSGWGTTDVLVTSATSKIDYQRSGGFPGGAAIVLREVATLLQREYKGRFNNVDRIDRAIVLGIPLQHNGEEIDLKPFLDEALHITIPIARSVLNTIRTPEDLTIFSGGGAGHYYLPALSKTLGCQVKLLDQPRFCNAIGFLRAGQAACRRRR